MSNNVKIYSRYENNLEILSSNIKPFTDVRKSKHFFQIVKFLITNYITVQKYQAIFNIQYKKNLTNIDIRLPPYISSPLKTSFYKVMDYT